MDDDLELPPLSQSAREQPAQTPPRPSLLLTRKRTLDPGDDEIATSSDPALFSSDEHAPGSENYRDGRRRKRTYKGTWWERHPAKRGTRESRRHRDFKRNFDSGIFMGSETDEMLSSDSATMEDELMRDQQITARACPNRIPRRWVAADAQGPSRLKLVSQDGCQDQWQYDQVCAIIQRCLDEGKEDVDLSFMSLSSLPGEVASLQTLSKQDEILPGMLEHGTNLEPHLRLYLANNLFIKVPAPILELRNLRVLSLRQNNLTSLPPTIRELVNLEELNVAGNQLTELPFEVIELIKCHQLRKVFLFPNPWYEITELCPMDDLPPPDCILQKKSPGQVTHIFAPTADPPIIKLFPSTDTHMGGRLSSLSETVLRQLARLDPHHQMDFAALMPADTPDAVLHRLAVLSESRGRRCTNCKRLIVLPGKEWLEWYFVDWYAGANDQPPAVYVPYRRTLCWEACAVVQPDDPPPGSALVS